MTTFDTTLKGTYKIENNKGELLAEVGNTITNLGMLAIAGHPVTNNVDNPINGTYNGANAPAFFLKGMISNLSLELTRNNIYGSPEHLDMKNPIYSTNIVPRTDNLLQINASVKASYVFNTSAQVKSLVTCHSIGPFDDARLTTTAKGVLPSPMMFESGETIYVTYTLRYITDCNKVVQNMPFNVGTSGVNLPPNKTNVRSTPVALVNSIGWATPEYQQFNAPLDIPRYQVPWSSYNTPLLSKWSDIYPLINLYFYSDVNIYDTMASTTASLTSLPPLKTIAGTPSFKHIFKKQVSSIAFVNGSTLPTWSTTLRFLFEPGEWPVTATGFSLLMGSNQTPSDIQPDRRANAGIFTALQVPYNPYKTRADMVVGIDYKFNWTRG